MTEAVLGIKVGDRAEFEKMVTAEDVARFADCTGDTNPLHRDPDYAAKTRFGQCIAHGTIRALAEVKGTDAQKRIVTVQTDCFNQNGEPVVKGEAVVLLDPVR